jgi:uncharacterized protein (DUF433 family)
MRGGGRPCIRSLRIRVKDVLDLLAAGASREEILEDYPLLEAADIAAVLEFAARQSDHPILRVAGCVFSSTHPTSLRETAFSCERERRVAPDRLLTSENPLYRPQ